jgi:hypothetical protein
MRRRIGAPSNHHEAAGKSMARNNMTPEEVISSAEHKNSARKYVGQDASFTSPSAAPAKGTLVAKKSTQASDSTISDKANRKNVSAGNAAASERMGARYRTSVNFAPTIDPAAGPTMANAKKVPSVSGRQAPNFNNGMNSVR